MMGKLTYDQVEEIINKLSISLNNIRSFLDMYKGNENMALRSNKITAFCNDLDKYIVGLSDKVNLSKDADLIVQQLVNKTN